MTYWIWLRRKGQPVAYHSNFLPGLVPERVLSMLTVAFAEELSLCSDCSMASHCHVIGPAGVKYCTVLFHDALRPEWSLEDVA